MRNKLYLFITATIVAIGLLFVFTSESATEQPEEKSETQSTLSLSDIHGLEVDIADPEKLYLPNHQGLYLQDTDTVIKKVGDISDDFMGFAVDPLDKNTFYASGHPKTGGNFGLIKTTDGGETWSDVSEGLNGPVDFHTMTIDRTDSNFIYGYYQGALQHSINGGESWEYVDSAPEQIIHLSSGTKLGRLYAGTARGLYTSNNGGETWSLFGFEGEAVVAIEPNSFNDTLLVSVADQGLLVSRDNGELWQKTDFPVLETVLYIASSPSKESRLYLITRSLEIYKSDDGGQTWSLR